jgi:hypothetical protein
MKHSILFGLLALLAVGNFAFGQTQFNYKDDFKILLSRSEQQNDELFYDKLLKRFNVNDPDLTEFQVLSLLIGFTKRPEFRPYQDLSIERNIYRINDDGQFKQALDSANLFLKTHPLSVKVLFEKAYSFHKLGLEDSAAHYVFKGRRIFEAMSYSGDGKTMETPIFALGPADGQDFIRRFINYRIGGAKIGSMGSGHDKDGNFIDILEVIPQDGSNPYNLYFIIQHATERMFTPEDKLKMKKVMTDMDKHDKKNKKQKE